MTDDSFTFKRTVDPDALTRLKREREVADGRYNDALTAVDQAVRHLPLLPDPPPPPDDTLIDPLNARWRLVPTHVPDFGSGLRAHVKRFIWKLVAPAFQQQHEFNGHPRRSLEPQRSTRPRAHQGAERCARHTA